MAYKNVNNIIAKGRYIYSTDVTIYTLYLL